IVDLTLDCARDIDAPQFLNRAVELGELRKTLLERCPLRHRVRDEAGIEAARENHVTLAERRERVAISRRQRRPAFGVDRVLVAAAKHEKTPSSPREAPWTFAACEGSPAPLHRYMSLIGTSSHVPSPRYGPTPCMSTKMTRNRDV